MSPREADESESEAEPVAATAAEIAVADLTLAPDVLTQGGEIERIAGQFIERGIRTTDVQLLAATKDLHLAKRTEQLAALMMSDSGNGCPLNPKWLRSPNGLKALNGYLSAVSQASSLRDRAIQHLARRDEWIMAGRGATQVSAVADDDPDAGVDAELLAMRKSAESA